MAPKGYASRAHLRRGEALQGRLIAQAFRTHTHDVDIVHHLHGSLAPRSLLKGYCSKAHPCTRAWRRGASGAPAFSTPSHASGAPAFRTHSRGIDIVHRCAHLYSGASLRGVYRGVESAVVPRVRHGSEEECTVIRALDGQDNAPVGHHPGGVESATPRVYLCLAHLTLDGGLWEPRG